MCFLIRSRKPNITWARLAGGVAAQPGSARSAASMAARTSSALASGTFLVTSPVAGL